MRHSISKGALGVLSVASVAALLAGCASAPEESATTSASAVATTKAVANFLPCMVSDAGGFDDKSFNQLGKEGLDQAAASFGIDPIEVQSNSDDDYAPNLQSLADQGCSLIISVGFNLSADTVAAAKANPKIDYAIIDYAADNDFDGKVDEPNIKPILFDTVQASFLAGYAAASYSKTGVVGTYGGAQYSTVTIFMDGFAEGVDYYNEQKSKDVKVIGWNVDKQKGSFTGKFVANDTAKQAAANLIDQDADVLMPVGGPIYQSAIEAIKDSGKDVAMVGVDADLTQTDPDNASYFLTSVQKGIKEATDAVVEQAGTEKTFDTTAYVGTLKNEGVGIAPFHSFESKVGSDLQSELDTIKSGIEDGSIKATSAGSPAAG